jgi:hypothetical protein
MRRMAVYQLVTTGLEGSQGRLVVSHAASKTRGDELKLQRILDIKIKSSPPLPFTKGRGLDDPRKWAFPF